MTQSWNVVLDAFDRQQVVSTFDTEEQATGFVEQTYPAYFREHDEVNVTTGLLGVTRVNRTIIIKPNLAHLEASLSDRQLNVKARLVELEVYQQTLSLAAENEAVSLQEKQRMQAFVNDLNQLSMLDSLKHESEMSEIVRAAEFANAFQLARKSERETELAELEHQLKLKRIKRESSPLLGWFWRWVGGKS